MDGTTPTSFVQRIRELLLLQDALRASSALTDAERARVCSFHTAGLKRLEVARDLRISRTARLSLSLYREGGHLLALAFLAHRAPARDLESLAEGDILPEIEGALRTEGSKAPVGIDRLAQVFAQTDPLDSDRLPIEEACQRAEELDTWTSWLASLTETRSLRQLRVSRALRITAVVSMVAATLAAIAIQVFSPTNVALRKPVTSSSRAYDTTPEGAVDGIRGLYDFHSAEEDSPWISIDLERRHVVTRVKVYGRADGVFDQSIPLALEASDDGVTFREVARRNEPFSDFDPWVVKPVALVARFIRLRTKRTSVLVINEVQVNGRPVP